MQQRPDIRTTKICTWLFLSWIGSVAAAVPAHADWPGWLGANRDGWVSDFEPPEKWPANLSKVWSLPVGTGYGSPLVIGDRVYQHARQGDQEVLFCVALADGRMIWKRRTPVPFTIAGGGERHGKGPKSCPVFSDGRVFTMSICGAITAWDAESGDRLWTQDHSAEFASFPKPYPNWGASTSPIVDGQRLFVHFGNDDAGFLAAMDVATGKELWRQGKHGASYSSPLVVELEGVRQVVEWNHETLIGVEIESGKELWSFPFPHVSHNQNMPTPARDGDIILLGGENRGIRGLRPKKTDNGWKVEEVWFQEKLALDMSTAIVNDGMLFGMSHYDRGRLFCLDTQTGVVHWTGTPRTARNVTFLSIPNHVLALTDSGSLRIIRADSTQYSQVAAFHVSDDESWAPPVLLPSGLLIKSKHSLTKWSF